MNYSFFIFHVFLLNAERRQDSIRKITCKCRAAAEKRLTKWNIAWCVFTSAGHVATWIIITPRSYLVGDVSTLIQFKLHFTMCLTRAATKRDIYRWKYGSTNGRRMKFFENCISAYIGQARNSLNGPISVRCQPKHRHRKTIIGARTKRSGGDYISPETEWPKGYTIYRKGFHIHTKLRAVFEYLFVPLCTTQTRFSLPTTGCTYIYRQNHNNCAEWIKNHFLRDDDDDITRGIRDTRPIKPKI